MKATVAVIARVAAHKAFEAAGLEEISMLVPSTPFGSSNPIHLYEADFGTFAVLSRHGEQGYSISAPFVNDRANLWALKNIGVEKVVSWSAPGSIDTNIAPGDLIIPDDVLDMRGGEPITFFKGSGEGVIRANPAFCPELRTRFLEVLGGMDLKVHDGGVYASMLGPRLETAAEIRMLERLGATLVGLTMSPEIWLARELEICYASICYSVNYAEGVLDRGGDSREEKEARPFKSFLFFEGMTTEEELARVDEVEGRFSEIALALLPAAFETPRECPCPQLLTRYYRRGDIDPDWWRGL